MGIPEYFTALGDTDAPSQSMFGVSALAMELEREGVVANRILAPATGLVPSGVVDPFARISLRQRLSVYRKVRDLSIRPDIGLVAGQRLRLSDYGLYGFGMVSSATFGDALKFSLDHISLAEPMMMQISRHASNGTVILQSHGLDIMGDLLPLAAEFWRSSLSSLFGLVIEETFPTKLMTFPFPAPTHWRSYRQILGCPVEFDADRLEWHFDASLLERPCPSVNPGTAALCRDVCGRMEASLPHETSLSQQIRAICLSCTTGFPTADVAARMLCMSVRTLHRRLADENTSYQSVLDKIKRQISIGQLENTGRSIDMVAESVGFADAASFRRAFKKWTGKSPTYYRN